ncbi:MAG: DNA-formamidopyrimidine glycosylase family protein [Ilumatobacteraceae bacterium]
MPEAPEVEVVRRGLAEGLTGRRFVSVSVGRERVVRRTSRPALIEGMTGARVMDVDRRGKYLTLALDTGRAVMIHLRMSGQVLLVDGADEAPAHTHVDALVAGCSSSIPEPSARWWCSIPEMSTGRYLSSRGSGPIRCATASTSASSGEGSGSDIAR